MLTGQSSRGGARTIVRRVPLQQATVRPKTYQDDGALPPRRPAPPRPLQRFNGTGGVGGNARTRITRGRAPFSAPIRSRGSASRQRFPPWRFNRRTRLPSNASPAHLRANLDAQLKEYMGN
ncbi:hypothetical protein AAHC03_09733 [Spirometra sp. Aus1]